MKKEVYYLIKQAAHKDRTLIGLSGLLNIDSEAEFQALTKALHELTEEGEIYRDHKGYYQLIKANKQMVKGTLDLKYQGFGFIIVDDETDHPDIYIAKTNIGTAMDKDYCLTEIIREKGKGRFEGRIVKVLERHITQVVGEYYEGQIFPKNDSGDIIFKLQKEDKKKVKNHQLIKAKIVKYGKSFIKECALVEVIGSQDDKDIEIKEVIHRQNLIHEFSDAELKMAKSMPDQVLEADLKGRIDLRDTLIFTIDGEYTKDIDDAISIKKVNNRFVLGVHIADVSHYVTEDSVLDKCAYNRGTSVYLANSVIPMLPKALSNGICSLNPKVDRLTMSCEMEITAKGEVVNYSIYPSVIHSREKMTYNNVNKMLSGDQEVIDQYPEIYEQLKIMHDLQKVLSGVREKMGSIDFEMIEPKFIFDQDGKITDLEVRDRGLGERMIEEFMLVANQVVATHMYGMKLPFIYRIHELPNQEKLTNIHRLLERFGFAQNVDDNQDQFNLQQILTNVEGSKYEKVITTLLLRSMAKAKYAREDVGHYGLAFEHYTHFTSPIRRYPDLIVHRYLRKYVFNNQLRTSDELKAKLDDIADQSSKMERIAMVAEREVMDMKKAEYMEPFVGETFTGVVSSVMKFGIFVELPNTVEGLVHVRNFDEQMEYNEETLSLVGNESKIEYTIGVEVNVKLVKVNRLLGKIDFVIV